MCVSRGFWRGSRWGWRAVPAVREMKSAGGSRWSLLPSFWVCTLGGSNGRKVPVLWLLWVTFPSPSPSVWVGGDQPQFGFLKEGSLWRIPHPPTPTPTPGERRHRRGSGRVSPWGRRILRVSPCHCEFTYPLPCLAPHSTSLQRTAPPAFSCCCVS